MPDGLMTRRTERKCPRCRTVMGYKTTGAGRMLCCSDCGHVPFPVNHGTKLLVVDECPSPEDVRREARKLEAYYREGGF